MTADCTLSRAGLSQLPLLTLQLVLVLVLLAACSAPPSDGTGRSTGVGTEPARQEEHSSRSADGGRFLGVIVARSRVEVAAESEGKVATVRVRLGDRVEQGAVLATLDPRHLEAELASARAALQVARAELTRQEARAVEAEERLQRRQALAGTVSAEVLREAGVAARVAAAERMAAAAAVDQLEAEVRGLQQRLADTRVLAPFAGVVAARHADPGQWLDRGTPIIDLLSAELLVRFAVPEPEAGSISVGSRLQVRLPGQEREPPASAIVLRVAPEVDAASGMVVAEAELVEQIGAAAALRPGAAVRVMTGGRS